MAKIRNPQDVHYLAFEGGGGKGVTFLGAIRALEQLPGGRMLPIVPGGENRIKGIAGASAGGITALLLAMGLDSGAIEKLLSRPQDFNAFFDAPRPGWYRSVNEKNEAGERTDRRPGSSLAEVSELLDQRRRQVDIVKLLAEALLTWDPLPAGVPAGRVPVSIAQLWGLVLVGLLALGRDKALPAYLQSQTDPIVKALGSDVQAYLYNLIYDRGIFPGFAVRKYFVRAINVFMDRHFSTLGITSRNFGQTLTFQEFYEITGVDLVVTGANVSQQQPAYFSVAHTPAFPVAEAIGITMNLPVLFKPVWVEAQVPTRLPDGRSQDAGSYVGFWVDGGMLNNLPLHAFDYSGAAPPGPDPVLRPLNPHTLAIRLTDGYKLTDERAAEAERKRDDAASSVFYNLADHLGGVLGTLLYPAEGGQLRTPGEQEQTIDLYTESLATTEFAPSEGKRAGPIKAAEREVFEYFGLP